MTVVPTEHSPQKVILVSVGQVLDGDASRRLHPVTVPGGEPWSMILGVDRLVRTNGSLTTFLS